MSDPTPTPTPTPTNKTPRRHGLLDKHQLAEISRCNIIFGVASDPDNFAKIKDDQVITDDLMTQFGKDLDSISQYTGGASEAALDSQLDTGGEAAAKRVLLAQIHYIQSKAKLKYPAHGPALAEYGVGANVDISRALLETSAGNIINKLKTDTLPKITAQHGTDLQAALDAYKKTKVDQVGGKGDATDLKTQLAQMVVSLAARRRQLQHAADGEFPFTDPASAGMRIKFDLPPDHPLNP